MADETQKDLSGLEKPMINTGLSRGTKLRLNTQALPEIDKFEITNSTIVGSTGIQTLDLVHLDKENPDKSSTLSTLIDDIYAQLAFIQGPNLTEDIDSILELNKALKESEGDVTKLITTLTNEIIKAVGYNDKGAAYQTAHDQYLALIESAVKAGVEAETTNTEIDNLDASFESERVALQAAIDAYPELPENEEDAAAKAALVAQLETATNLYNETRGNLVDEKTRLSIEAVSMNKFLPSDEIGNFLAWVNFVQDNNLDEKTNHLQNSLDKNVAFLDKKIDENYNKILGGAGKAFDTLLELQEALNSDPNAFNTLMKYTNSKVEEINKASSELIKTLGIEEKGELAKEYWQEYTSYVKPGVEAYNDMVKFLDSRTNEESALNEAENQLAALLAIAEPTADDLAAIQSLNEQISSYKDKIEYYDSVIKDNDEIYSGYKKLLPVNEANYNTYLVQTLRAEDKSLDKRIADAVSNGSGDLIDSIAETFETRQQRVKVAGVIDGSNTTFTLSHLIFDNTDQVILNGMMLTIDVDYYVGTYVEDGGSYGDAALSKSSLPNVGFDLISTINFYSAPLEGDTIQVYGVTNNNLFANPDTKFLGEDPSAPAKEDK